MQFPKVGSTGSSSGPVAWTGKGASKKVMTVTNKKGIHPAESGNFWIHPHTMCCF